MSVLDSSPISVHAGALDVVGLRGLICQVE